MRYSADTITDDALDELYARLAAAEAAVRRLDGMATAWVERLPEAIRTTTAAEAVQIVTRRVLEAVSVPQESADASGAVRLDRSGSEKGSVRPPAARTRSARPVARPAL